MINKYFYHQGKSSYIGVHLLHQPDFGSNRVYDRSIKAQYIIDQNSTFKQTWDTTILILIMYTAIIEPLHIAYWSSHQVSAVIYLFLSLNILIDLIFTVDIFINFFSSYQKPDGT